MASKFYVVWQGRKPGIYRDWPSCQQQVDKFPGAKYKSFPTQAEAEKAYGNPSRTKSALTSTRTTSAHSNSAKGASSSGKRLGKAKTVNTLSAAEVDGLDFEVKIFTDGGCEPNPGESGSGAAVYQHNELISLWYGLYAPMGTNNTAELNALHQAMIMSKESLQQNKTVAIFCDSKYAIQCITQWAASWEKKGWKKSGGEIKNLALIQSMFSLYQALQKRVNILHVNGHVGVEGNELADRMSILAIESKEVRWMKYTKKIQLTEILSLRTG